MQLMDFFILNQIASVFFFFLLDFFLFFLLQLQLYNVFCIYVNVMGEKQKKLYLQMLICNSNFNKK